jgi:CheY-like chemotaxis protein
MAGHGHSVMVVDDNQDGRESLCALLQYAGFSVTCARNGREALGLLERDELPCMILLDLHMPEMDGFEFRSIQVRDPRWSHIPVVVYSGHYDVGGAADLLSVRHHFRKPLDLDAIVALATEHCPRD